MTVGVRLEGISKTFQRAKAVRAVDDLDLEVSDGELLVLLGPSGCGKTTTLRCIAGLDEPDGGRITIGDRVVFAAGATSVPPAKRDIGMVFQSYALWPHKTVRGNIAYPLRARKLRRALADGWVESAAAVVDCSDLLDRYPGQLSGGQQQRIAVARGLVARPTVLLFDEPLSNLDAKLRDQVRGELHQLHRRLRFTSVYVTHDQHEAMAVGDRLAVMRAGRIEQADTPPRVFEQPATDYVADFVGYTNRIELVRVGDGWTTAAGSVIGLGPQLVDEHVILRIRPEDLEVLPVDEHPEGRLLLGPVRVADITFAGRRLDVMLDTGAGTLRASVPTALPPPAPGSDAMLAVDPTDARCFGPDGERRQLAWMPMVARDADEAVREPSWQ